MPIDLQSKIDELQAALQATQEWKAQAQQALDAFYERSNDSSSLPNRRPVKPSAENHLVEPATVLDLMGISSTAPLISVPESSLNFSIFPKKGLELSSECYDCVNAIEVLLEQKPPIALDADVMKECMWIVRVRFFFLLRFFKANILCVVCRLWSGFAKLSSCRSPYRVPIKFFWMVLILISYPMTRSTQYR